MTAISSINHIVIRDVMSILLCAIGEDSIKVVDASDIQTQRTVRTRMMKTMYHLFDESHFQVIGRDITTETAEVHA